MWRTQPETRQLEHCRASCGDSTGEKRCLKIGDIHKKPFELKKWWWSSSQKFRVDTFFGTNPDSMRDGSGLRGKMFRTRSIWLSKWECPANCHLNFCIELQHCPAAIPSIPFYRGVVPPRIGCSHIRIARRGERVLQPDRFGSHLVGSLQNPQEPCGFFKNMVS